MFLRPRMTRTGGHAGPYVWGGVTGVTNSDNPWLTAVQENTATRLVVSGGSYDAEQRFLVNENPLSVRTALGVGLGSAGCAGPVFAPDMYGAAVWFGQNYAAAYVSCTVPALTSASTFTIEGTYRGRLSPSGDTYLALLSGGAYVQLESSGEITFYDGSAADTSASTVATLLSLSSSWDEFEWRAAPAGTSLDVDVRVPGGSWVSAISGATITAVPPGGQTLYYGSSSTTKGMRAVGRRLTIRDGGVAAVKVAEFTPGMFVGGNRADGDTAVDAYGVTWTVERPAATTDMPRVMVGGDEQYISLPGGSGEYVSTPDTAALSITGDIDLRVRVQLPTGLTAPASTYTLISKRVSGQRSYWFRMNTNGALALSASTDGLVDAWTATSDGMAFTADTPVWLRVTMAAATGTVYHYYSYSNTSNSADVVWTEMAGSGDVMGATTIADTTAELAVGATWGSGAADRMTGRVYVAEVWDGIDGTLVERIDAAEASTAGATWTSATSSATVTLKRSSTVQPHAALIPASTTVIQTDGSDDFFEVVGDDSLMDFVPATGLTLFLDALFTAGAGSGGVFASSANATSDDGLIVSRNSTNSRVQGRLDDGTTITTVGDNTNNVTYGARFVAAFAFGDSDHEAYVDGSSVETATDAVGSVSAAGPLRFGAEIDGSNLAAFDFFGVAVVADDLADADVAAISAEGLVA